MISSPKGDGLKEVPSKHNLKARLIICTRHITLLDCTDIPPSSPRCRSRSCQETKIEHATSQLTEKPTCVQSRTRQAYSRVSHTKRCLFQPEGYVRRCLQSSNVVYCWHPIARRPETKIIAHTSLDPLHCLVEATRWLEFIPVTPLAFSKKRLLNIGDSKQGCTTPCFRLPFTSHFVSYPETPEFEVDDFTCICLL